MTKQEQKHQQQLRLETLKLISKVKRKLRKVFNIPIIGKTEKHKALLKDVEMMHVDLLHLLTKAKIKTSKEYVRIINAFLELEYEAYNYNNRPMYKIGQMHSIVKLILIKHQLIEIEENLTA